MLITEYSQGGAARPAELAQVKQAILAGADLDEVFERTGWFPGPDGILRYEVPDREAVITGPIDDQPRPLAEIMDHPELFRAMPELARVTVSMKDMGWLRAGEAEIGGNHINLASGNDHDSLLHEIQHHAQYLGGVPRDNFSYGPEYEGTWGYYWNYTEVEARDAASRAMGWGDPSGSAPKLLDLAKELDPEELRHRIQMGDHDVPVERDLEGFNEEPELMTWEESLQMDDQDFLSQIRGQVSNGSLDQERADQLLRARFGEGYDPDMLDHVTQGPEMAAAAPGTGDAQIDEDDDLASELEDYGQDDLEPLGEPEPLEPERLRA